MLQFSSGLWVIPNDSYIPLNRILIGLSLFSLMYLKLIG